MGSFSPNVQKAEGSCAGVRGLLLSGHRDLFSARRIRPPEGWSLVAHPHDSNPTTSPQAFPKGRSHAALGRCQLLVLAAGP